MKHNLHISCLSDFEKNNAGYGKVSSIFKTILKLKTMFFFIRSKFFIRIMKLSVFSMRRKLKRKMLGWDLQLLLKKHCIPLTNWVQLIRFIIISMLF